MMSGSHREGPVVQKFQLPASSQVGGHLRGRCSGPLQAFVMAELLPSPRSEPEPQQGAAVHVTKLSSQMHPVSRH